MPGHRVCPVCAGSDQYGRMLAEADEEAAKKLGENTPARKPRPWDGRHSFVRMLTPLEFEERREASRGKSPSAPIAPRPPVPRS